MYIHAHKKEMMHAFHGVSKWRKHLGGGEQIFLHLFSLCVWKRERNKRVK